MTQTSGLGGTKLPAALHVMVFCLTIAPHWPIGHDGGAGSVTTVGRHGPLNNTHVLDVSTQTFDHVGEPVAAAHELV